MYGTEYRTNTKTYYDNNKRTYIYWYNISYIQKQSTKRITKTITKQTTKPNYKSNYKTIFKTNYKTNYKINHKTKYKPNTKTITKPITKTTSKSTTESITTLITTTKDCSYCSPKEEDKINHMEYEQETTTHILCECPAFSKIRQEQYGTYKMNTEELITKNTEYTIKNMIKFMNKTGSLSRNQKYTKKQLSPRRMHKNNKRKTTETPPNTQNTAPKQRKIKQYST